MNEVLNILSDCRAKGITLVIDDAGENIKVTGNIKSLSGPDKEALKRYKADILSFLKKMKHTAYSAITPSPIAEYYPLSSAQKRLWILSQFENGNAGYNIPMMSVFEGELNQDILTQAFNSLIVRHEILRTIFKENEQGEVKQFVLPANVQDFTLSFKDVREDADQAVTVSALATAAITAPFDLAKGPLLRAGLLRISDDKWVFVYCMHHIISDGWSMDILINELLWLYHTYSSGENDTLEPLQIQYKDYAVWQQEQLGSEVFHGHKTYWLNQLGGQLPVLELPEDYTRPTVKTYHGNTIHQRLQPAAGKAIKALSAEQGTTLFTGLLAAVNALLYRYTGQEDIIIGSPIAGREQVVLENQVGFYVNTLALRTQLKGTDSFRELIDRVKQVVYDAHTHQAYPFDELIDELDIQRDTSRNALFDVMVVLQNTGDNQEPKRLGQLNIHEYKEVKNPFSKFDLTFDFRESGEIILLDITYNSDIYNRETITQLTSHLLQLLDSMLAYPDTPVNRLDYLNITEKEQLLQTFNDTSADYDREKTIIDLFETQVRETPDNIAIIFEERTLTYAGLNEMSNRLAHYLSVKYVIQADDLIGIKLPRNEWMIIAMLGVLKAGGAYVPIDPGYPEERIDFMIKDSQCKVVIDDTVLELFRIAAEECPVENLSPINAMDNLAYVIYTSGSTGQPKGVMIEHRNVAAFIDWCKNEFRNNPIELVLGVTSICFDLSVFEIFFTICTGKQLRILQTALSIPQYLDTARHILLNTVPSVVGVLLRDKINLNTVSVLNMAGEPIPESYFQQLNNGNTVVRNLYGPSEDTTYSTVYQLTATTPVLIGRPISNTQIYILNEQQQLQPIGVAGEICISGEGVARGYLNKHALTAEKFVAHPFKAGARLYKTGDQGKWLPDGNIAFIGRKDEQVKVRGYRIELGEIESALQTHQDIEAAVVVAKPNKAGEKELVAYIVSKIALYATDIRTYLNKRLPTYMLPDHFVRLAALPLTANGKADRKRLPDPEGAGMETGTPYVAPRNETEKKLVEIWKEILGKEKIGVRDNFFEAGGHSLKATRLSSRIHKFFEVIISLNDLFEYPVLEAQAQLIAQAGKTAFINILPAPLQEYYPLSSAQKRLFFLHEFAPQSTSYNMPLVNYLGKSVDKDRITTVLKQLIDRHESFRTSFVKIDGVAMQQLHTAVQFELDEHQCTQEDFTAYLDAFIRPFDISKAPLLRSSLVKVDDIGYMWVVDIHHIISDGTSQLVLADDFMQLYQGRQLPALRLQYRDFSTWQNNLLESAELKVQEAYWLSQFSKGISKLNFPVDRPRPATFTFEGDVYEFTLDASLTALIRDFGNRYQGTLQMTLLSVLNILLHKYTGQDDLVIGCGIAGRRHPDLERIVGMFVNTLAIRNFPSGEQHFTAFYKEVIANCIAAYEHQDVQFEDLVDMLKVERDPSANPIFDVALVVQNYTASTTDSTTLLGELTVPGTAMLLQWKGTRTAKFDMSWFVTERNDDIVINLEYYSAIYDRSSIVRLTEHFKHVLKTVLAQPDILLSGVNMLTATEEEGLLTAYVKGEKLELPAADTFHRIFEKQCALTPEHIAVSDKEGAISYQELNRRADQLAFFLVHRTGLQREERVGVLQSRNTALLVSILGILKAGGVYVPLDANYPEQRLLYMLDDAGINILLTAKDRIEFSNRLQWRGKGIQHLVCVDSLDIFQERGLWRNDLMRKDLWDHVGTTATDAISGGGWMSSYTGTYLSEQEMKEYSDNAWLKLKDYLHPQMKVLEIGCSSGLTMFRIAPYVGSYHGTDLSSVILENTTNVINENGYTNITLSCMPAHEIDQLETGDFDLVIINSVIQSFDGHNYLRDVLEKAIGKMKSTGWLFIGDIMDEDKRQALIDDLTAFKQFHDGEGFRTKTDLSAELFVSRGYLDDLIRDHMGIADIQYSDKIYTIANELTDYRYDALLRINKEAPLSAGSRHRYQHDLRHIGAQPAAALNTEVSSTDLAYLIYTSGSTGKPKGVMIEHRNIVAFLGKCKQTFRPAPSLVMPVLASHAFDISLFEIFLPLLAGGTAMMINEEQVKDVHYLAEQLQRVNAFHAVPALMYQVTGYIAEMGIKEKYAGIKDLFVGGDTVPTAVLEAMREIFPQACIHVLYGPTESTIFVTANHYLSGEDKLFRGALIGKPNPGTAVYITDESQQLLPVGVVGEICLGGAILARGYLNQPALTAEKFVLNPFNNEERLYKTGDLGRWLADGTIEFAGRKDDQVKIRGYRIELGEIEHVLQQHPEIEDAAVIARSNAAGEKELAAYIVSRVSLNTADIRSHLSRTLPDYMVPVHYVPLTALPLTANGKVDRRNLPSLVGLGLSTGVTYIAPRNETEEKLVQIWQEILEREAISVKDNFFEIGGHSLKATRLSSRIHKVFDVKVALNELFVKVILEDQALLIASAVKTAFVTIPVADPQPAYVLSSSQRRLWILSQFEDGNLAYNMPGVQVFEGKLDRGALEASFAELIARHESLRTIFQEHGTVKQAVLPATDTGFSITYGDLRSEKEQDALIAQLVHTAAATPFNLASGPLLRAALYQTTDHTWVFIYVIHHIIGDGWSMDVLINELLQLYNGFVHGNPVALAPLRIQYKDYASWQQEQLKGAALEPNRHYWLTQFAGALPILDLPADKPRPAVKTHHGAVVNWVIEEALSTGLHALSREQGATLFMGLLATVNTLLYRYTRQEDIIVGTPIAGREHADLENQIGIYINTLALRTRFSGEDSFKTLLNNIKSVTLQAYEHQIYPFDELIDELPLKRDLSRSALFDVMVTLQNTSTYHSTSLNPDELKVSAYKGEIFTGSKFDLIFTFIEEGEKIQATIQYNTDIYTEGTISRLARHLSQLLAVIIAQPSTPIRHLDYLSVTEKHILLTGVNETATTYPADKTIPSLFVEQVAKTPDNIALVFEDSTFTYKQLDEISNRLAHHLQHQYNIQPDDLVGIVLDRSALLIIAILGVLKAGGAYVPIDPEFPAARKAFMTRDTGIKALITQTDYHTNPEYYNGPVFLIDVQLEDTDNIIEAPVTDLQADHLAYVMYTSGSTGVPKGVMIPHRGVVRLVKSTNYVSFTDHKTLVSTGAVSFDATCFEYWGMLLHGGKLVLCSKEVLLDSQQLAATIREHGGDLMWFTSGWLNELIDRDISIFSGLKTILTGGDRLSTVHLNAILHQYPGINLISCYGPTENSTFSSTHPVMTASEDDIPLGKPISNSTCYVLDNWQQLVPVGVAGEICVGGEGLARGYLNQPDLTADKFIAHPFIAGQRLYKTGDIGKWLPDGNLAFIGRQDEQIKIRGYRVELGEIESVLQNYESVISVVVIAISDGAGEKELVAYIVSKEDLNISAIRTYLSKQLPGYMVPGYFVRLEALPLNANGKLDRSSLPDPEGLDRNTDVLYVAPRNEVEKKLLLIWQEILGREQISVKDSFFEIGGHSLKVTRLSAQIHKVFDVKLSMKEIFTLVTLEEQAALIAQSTVQSYITIPLAPEQSGYVLSSSQRRLWVLSQFTEGNAAYNIPGVYLFEGALDLSALEYAFDTLLERHEILRTIFKEDEAGELRQFIRPAADTGFRISSCDLRKEAAGAEQVKALIASSYIRPFDLATGPLLRVELYQLADHQWIFSYVMHHIISDGWSMGILINELLQIYNAFIKGAVADLPPLRIQYKDYAVWLQHQLSGTVLQAHKDYWLQLFEGTLPILELPADKPRPAMKTYDGGVINKVLSAATTTGLKALCRQQGSTLFMGLLAAVNALLYRYTRQEDIIIGSSIAGREHADLDDQIGFYVNTLALRTQFKGSNSYKELLELVKQLTLGAYEHQVYPFDELVDALHTPHDTSRNPLFDVTVVLQNTDTHTRSGEQTLDALQVSSYKEVSNPHSKFDLSFDFAEIGDTIRTILVYNTDIYTKSTIERMFVHLEQLLSAIIAAPDMPVNTLDYLSEQEQQELLVTFNDTATAYPADKTIPALFAEQVKKTPHQVALVFEGRSLTYKELDEKANRLAHHLRDQYHIQADDLVGIMVDRSASLIIAILGVLKSGGAYVPIDPDYPLARKSFIIADTGIKALITQTEYIFDLEYYSGPVFAIDVQLEETAQLLSAPVIDLDAGHLAYVMYTSGSMGVPKGVMIPHRGVVRLVKPGSYACLTGNETLLSTGAVSFDATSFEYWGMLLNGGKLVLCSKETLLDSRQLAATIRDNGVDMMWFTAGWLNELVDRDISIFSSLKTILAGGDRLSPAHINTLLHHYPGMRIVNGYGPTENTTFSLTGEVMAGLEDIPVGKPIGNSTVYILDSQHKVVPVGVVGEICVGGAGLARGYLNQPDLTAERFIAHPFIAGERLYKTGDLGRWLPDGNIAFTGRQDAQVKIRGYRIELGEIESVLQNYEPVSSAVVIARLNSIGEKELVAYVVGKETLNTAAIRTYLSQTLPDYMVPGYFIQLEALPLTANGKVDRNNLPDPEGLDMNTGVPYVAPRNEVEEQLVLIWQEILDREQVSVKDNFFEIGGHSLKATRLSSQIHKVFNVKLSLNELFSRVVLEEQAALIAQSAIHSFVTIPLAPVQPGYVLSSSQRRLWVLSQFAEGNVAYNISSVYMFEGEVNIAALEHSFNALLERHEILRTVFREDEMGELRQFIQAATDTRFSISYSDLRNEVANEQQVSALVQSSFVQPFDLATGPLWKVNLYQLTEHQWIFSYVMHHIISDGWSMGVLINELLQLYNAFIKGETMAWPALRIQYKDYAAWQQEQLNSAALQAHKDYWLHQFEGTLPILDMPADKPRPAIKTYNGGVIHQWIDADVTRGLKALCQEQGSTLFMGLLAAVNVLLHRYTRQEDIVIGTPIAGREHADLEGQIGFYINTLALRTRFNGSDNFQHLLSDIRELTLWAYEHQVYPFDELVDALHTPHDMSRNPLFDVTVALQNTDTDTRGQTLGTLQVSGYKAAEDLRSKFDLSFDFAEIGDAIKTTLVYNTDIYTKSTIERMFVHLEQLLSAIIAAPDMPVNTLDYLSEQEQQELLVTFNDTATAYPADKTIPALFAEQVKKTPHQVALVFEGRSLTYKELDEKANRLAHHLRDQYHIQADDLVGIMVDRSASLIIAILGVLKSGGAYVPIDPDYPLARKSFIIADTGIKALITQTEYIFDLEYYSGPVFAIDVQLEETAQLLAAPVIDLDAGHLAYVMYTSGSMGVPKGVMIPHRGVVRLVKPGSYACLTGNETLLSTGAVSFDATSFEYWGMLLNGGKLVLCSKETLLDSRQLAATIRDNGVDMMWFTAGWLNELVDRDISIFSGLKTILAGGDRLSPAHINTLLHHYPGMRIVNGYGPTENTTFSLTGEVMAGLEDIPVGKPIGNSTVYILDSQHKVVPVGVVGEICVGGAGLARGYLNQPDLTAERFIAHPFIAGERLYKTGDLGRWLPDGNIAFTGRQDAQVKIRGYRIELGEIESVLQNYEPVSSAVVIARLNSIGEKELVAYIVGKETLNTAAIRTYLSQTLPDYMVPGYFIQLEALPLTANGKVDRNNLPDPEGLDMNTGVPYVAPRNEVEEQLVLIWQEILDREQVSVKDNFFEIGGHSLKATRLSSQIHKVFNVKLSLNELFSQVVLEEQAALIAQSAIHSFVTIPLAPAQPGYVLSSSQRRLWVLSQFAEGNVAYNIPGVYVFEGEVNVAALEHSFNALLERHEILRTVFREDEDGELRQFVKSLADIDFYITQQDLRKEAALEQKLEEQIQLDYLRPFDLATGPLIHATLIRVAAEKWVFSYVIHHIISDGWSMEVLISELLHLYNVFLKGEAISLPALRIQYKDYAVWQQEQLSGATLQTHRDYWLQQFEGPLPILELPADKPRPTIKTYNGAATHKSIDSSVSQGIKTLCRKHGSTLFMGLLAAVNTLLHRYTRQEDIVIGSPVAGREHADLEGQIGFYVNTLALRTRFKSTDSYAGLLEQVKQLTLDAYTHQVYPFDELVDALHPVQDMSRNPLFDVTVVLQNASLHKSGDPQNLGTLKVNGYEGATTRLSKFDLTFDFMEVGETIQLHLIYNSDIYTKNTADQLARHLEQLLAAVIAQPDAPVGTIDYLSAAEQHALLTSFDATAVNYPTTQTIVHLFETQAAQTPDNTALVFEGTALTYKALNERANQLGDYLRQQYHIQAGDLVGIQLGRSEQMVIAILGILKSGAAYVPVDPEYPPDRIDYMITDSQCKVVIDEAALLAFSKNAHGYTKQNLPVISGPDDPAYVIYTSGTTGRPKGTLITHRNVVRLFKNDQPLFDFRESDVWTLFHSYCFDFSVWEMYGALLFGGKLIIISSLTARDPQAFIHLLEKEGVTVLNQTPSSFYNMLKQAPVATHIPLRLRYVIFGGEALSPGKLKDWKARYPDIKLINMYGITETTVHVTYKEITEEEIAKNISNIGIPVPTLSCYVLDEHRQLLPPGVPGELYIGGAGVAKGYLNRDELNRERFIENPFKAGERLYRSGDTVKISAGWELEYLGRIDAQVKIRGYRIELGEIENAIQEHPAVTAAVVIAISVTEEEKELVAYITSREALNTSGMRAWLSKRLPDYMVPGYFVQLDTLPLTANGKVDRKRLPDPEGLGMETGIAYIAPRNEIEETLVLIWQEILGRERIGVKDNFFEIGGHSLKATRLIMQVKKTFRVTIALKSIFLEPTIEMLADKIKNDTWLQTAMVADDDSFEEIRI